MTGAPTVPQTIGRFQVRGRLGRGGMGEVFLAYDLELSREVAIKRLGVVDAPTRARFLREARAQARVDHEHICPVYEVGEAEGHPYLVMHLVQGSTLREAASSMELETKLDIMRQVAEAVHAAHLLGLIHRDLKPSNVMVERDARGSWPARTRLPAPTTPGRARSTCGPWRSPAATRPCTWPKRAAWNWSSTSAGVAAGSSKRRTGTHLRPARGRWRSTPTMQRHG